MSAATDYKLGDSVWFTSTLQRVEERRTTGNGGNRYWKVWQPVDHELRHGVVVGKRTLANGWIESGYDEPTTFYAKEHLTAWLVAYDMHRKPVLALLDDELSQRGDQP